MNRFEREVENLCGAFSWPLVALVAGYILFMYGICLVALITWLTR